MIRQVRLYIGTRGHALVAVYCLAQDQTPGTLDEFLPPDTAIRSSSLQIGMCSHFLPQQGDLTSCCIPGQEHVVMPCQQFIVLLRTQQQGHTMTSYLLTQQHGHPPWRQECVHIRETYFFGPLLARDSWSLSWTNSSLGYERRDWLFTHYENRETGLVRDHGPTHLSGMRDGSPCFYDTLGQVRLGLFRAILCNHSQVPDRSSVFLDSNS